VENQARIRVLGVYLEELEDPLDAVCDGVAVQVQASGGLADGSLLVEIGLEGPDRRVGPDRA
jgi:hypothetical protein